MKRIWIYLALLLVCTLVLAGCGKSEESTAMTGTTDGAVKKELAASPTFAEALVQNGFVSDISSSDVEKRLSEWSHEGKTLLSYEEGPMMGDGLFGFTTIYGGEGVFSWTIDYQWNVDRSFADYTNSFRFVKPIDGVAMPYGIGFDNGLDDLIEALALEVDFSSDQDQLLERTLIPDYESKLVLTAERKLVFSEYFESVRPLSDGEQLRVLVTRSVALDFDSKTNRLKAVSFEDKERHVYNEEALLDPQTFSHALDRNGFLPEEADSNLELLLVYCSCEGELLSRYYGKTVSDDFGYTMMVETNDFFSGSSRYRVADGQNNERYDITLSFYRPIEGLAMPYGLSFGDSLTDLLATLGFSSEPWVDGENAWTMTLDHTASEGYESTLVLIDGSRMSDIASADWALVFTEYYQATYRNGEVYNLTRSVRLDFGAKTGMNAITFSITEEAVGATAETNQSVT